MTDSVCTAYESQKQRNNSSSTLKGTVLCNQIFIACLMSKMSYF